MLPYFAECAKLITSAKSWLLEKSKGERMNKQITVEIGNRVITISVPREEVQETIANLIANTEVSWVGVER